MSRRHSDGSNTCGWGCEQRDIISDWFSGVINATEAIRRTSRRDEPVRPKKEFRINGRMMRGDEGTWQEGLPENLPIPQDDPVDVERNLLQPVIGNIVNLVIKDEQGEHDDLDKIRQISSSLSILAEAFERVVANGGIINDSDRESINQGVGGILQLAFYSDLRQSE